MIIDVVRHLTIILLIQNSLAGAVVKAPKSCHITPVLRSIRWLKITERIEYKLLSLTHKNPHNHPTSIISTTSSLFNLLAALALHLWLPSRPPTSYSLRITDRFFRYTPHPVSGINFLVLSVNLISALLSLSCLFMLLPHLLTLSTHHSHHP